MRAKGCTRQEPDPRVWAMAAKKVCGILAGSSARGDRGTQTNCRSSQEPQPRRKEREIQVPANCCLVKQHTCARMLREKSLAVARHTAGFKGRGKAVCPRALSLQVLNKHSPCTVTQPSVRRDLAPQVGGTVRTQRHSEPLAHCKWHDKACCGTVLAGLHLPGNLKALLN